MTPTSFFPNTSNTLEKDVGWFSPQLMMNTRDLQVFNMYGEIKNAGTIAGPLFPSNAMELLVSAIGTDAVTGSSPYTHTISQSDSLASLTIEKNIGGFQSLQFAGCMANKLTLKCATGNSAVEMSADILAQSAAILTTPTAFSIVDEIPYIFTGATLTLFTHARAEARSVSITVDNGVKEDYTFNGSGNPNFLTPETLHVNGTVDLYWSSLNDSTYGDFTSMVNGTVGALSIAFAQPGGINTVTITLPKVVLSKYGNDIKVGDLVVSTLSFEAAKSLSSGYTIQAVVTNAVSTAY